MFKSKQITLAALIDATPEEFLVSQIQRHSIDVSSEWSDLDDEQRDLLVSLGIVLEVEADVTCTDAESWLSDWRPENQAAWPCYTLQIDADGMDPLELTGWHIVGMMGPDGNRRYSEWDQDDSDGCCTGLPRLSRNDEWTIESGEDVGVDHVIPCWRDDDGQYWTLDRDTLDDLIRDAAGDADHGSEPTWEDVDRDDMEIEETVYVVSEAGQVVEVELLFGGVASYEEEYDVEMEEYDYDRNCSYKTYRTETRTQYMASAWSHSLTDEIFEDRNEAERDLIENHAHEDAQKIYRKEENATKALCRIAFDRHDTPDELETGEDEDGAYVSPEGVDEERYHLTADQASSLYHVGWVGVMEEIAEAFGLRKTLAAMRQRNQSLDEIVAECDPFVSVADSLAAGNCQQTTEAVRQSLVARLGEVGGVRSNILLAYRDDAYTRRAVRMAALRYLSNLND